MHDEAPLSLPYLSPARRSLEAVPMKAARLLHAITMSLSLRTQLARHGYGPEDHREGLELLRECIGPEDVVWPEAFEADVRDAVVEIDAWDEKGFRLVEATLSHRFPAQARFVLLGLEPSSGPAAVAGVRHLLDRLDALESAEERQRSRKEDHAALQALARRGITVEERKRLRSLVERAGDANARADRPSGPHPTDHETRLVALDAWFDEWASVARAVVTREDHLVRLGLASPRGPVSG
jgi:hypothetical protein